MDNRQAILLLPSYVVCMGSPDNITIRKKVKKTRTSILKKLTRVGQL